MPAKNLPALTALRAFAALWVFLFHFCPATGVVPPVPFSGLIANGYLGVSLFFLLSGFVLAHSCVDETGYRLTTSVSAFIAARLSRLAPSYFLGWLLSWAFVIKQYALSGRVEARTLGAAGSSAILLQAWSPNLALGWNSPGWSVSVEWCFYLLFPALIVRIGRSAFPIRTATAAWLLTLAPPVWYIVLSPDGLGRGIGAHSHGDWLGVVKFNPLMHLGTFVAGVCLALAHKRGRLRWLRGAGLGVLTIGCALGLASIRPGVLYPVYHNGLLTPFFAAVIAWCANQTAAPPALVRIGEASYSLYILQVSVWAAYHNALGALAMELPPLWKLLGLLAFAVVVCLVALELVEKPGRRALRNLLGRLFSGEVTLGPFRGTDVSRS